MRVLGELVDLGFFDGANISLWAVVMASLYKQ
jgi:hypothetical protein